MYIFVDEMERQKGIIGLTNGINMLYRFKWLNLRLYTVNIFIFHFQQAILASIHSPEIENRNPTIAFNLIFQFLFFELRNANKVRKWFHRKLSLELDELISKTTTGKLFDKLSVSENASCYEFSWIFCCFFYVWMGASAIHAECCCCSV